MFKILSYIVVAIILYVILYIIFTRKQKMILIERRTGLGGPDKDIEYVSIYFNKEVYSKFQPELIDGEHYFVPLRSVSLYLGRTLFKNYAPDGQIFYSYDGYDQPLTILEMAKAFKIVESCSFLEEHMS